MSVTCYPSPDKAKARAICEAFARGCDGKIGDWRKGLQPGAAFFYGVVKETRPLFDAARASGADWYYADNSYFDRGRQAYFRVTKNSFQHTGVGLPDYKRLDLIGAKIKPWREEGAHVLVCEQSPAFMDLVGASATWTIDVCDALRRETHREIRVRRWDRDKAKLMATLRQELVGAWALVTHMSAAANEALLTGVPVFVTGECAAARVASGHLIEDFRCIENPIRPGGRSEWAGVLAAQQWTLDEIKSGECWRKLNE